MLHTPTMLAFGIPGNWEWLLIGLIALLLFGNRLPSVARSIGDGIREFKKGLRDVTDDVKSSSNDNPTPNPHAVPPLTSGDDQRVSTSRPGDPVGHRASPAAES